MDRQVALLVVLAACGGESSSPDAACTPAVLYLNRTGGAWDKGAHDDASANLSVLLDGPRTLAPWPKDDTDWDLLLPCLRTALSPFPLTITETDPGAAPHVELVFTDQAWIGSVATTSFIPASCRPDHEVAFIFGNALPTRARQCHVALRAYAQMIANLSFGDQCQDVLNDQPDCVSDRSFNDVTATCVDASAQPAPCRCGGSTQNSYQAMSSVLRACP